MGGAPSAPAAPPPPPPPPPSRPSSSLAPDPAAMASVRKNQLQASGRANRKSLEITLGNTTGGSGLSI